MLRRRRPTKCISRRRPTNIICLRRQQKRFQPRGIGVEKTDGGGVAEWLKALAWKAGKRIKPFREFESHPLRHYL